MSSKGSGSGEEVSDDDDEGEKEDEEKKEEDDENAGRPMGRPPLYQTFAGDDYDDVMKGNFLTHEGTKLFAYGPKNQCGVLLIGDFWGWGEGRLREIVDYLGIAAHARVVCPKLLDEPAFGDGTEGDGLPPGFDTEERKKDFKPWIMKYTWEFFKPKVEAALMHLRGCGVKRIGGVGFGFGAWVVARMSATVNEFTCNVFLYPQIEQMEKREGRDVDIVARKVKGVSLFMTGEEDPNTYYPKGEVFELILKNNPGTYVMEFDEMESGWVLRGDLGQPNVRPMTEKAVSNISRHLRKYLWPPPLGANSSTIRRAARDGDADTVQNLCASGVPITGIEGQDTVGLLPLHYACREGQAMCVKFLIEGEADINEHGGIGAETPLHLAAYTGKAKAVKIMLEGVEIAGRGRVTAEIESLDKTGQTPLHHAARAGHVGVVKFLIQKSASMYSTDTAGQTPLHLAAYAGKQQAVMLLLQLKMDVDPEDLRVQTPQKRAIQMGFNAISDLLQNVREQRQAEAKAAAEEALDAK